MGEKQAMIDSSDDSGLKERLNTEIEQAKEMDIGEWCATYPYWYRLMHTGAGKQDSDSVFATLNPWYERSYFIQVHNAWFLFYMLYCVFSTSDVTVKAVSGVLLLLSGIFQLIFVLASIMGEARRWQFLHFFNPQSKMAPVNSTNFGLLVCLWVEFLAIAATQEALGEWKARDSNKLIITFSAMCKFFQVCNFAVETPSVRLLVYAVAKTLPNLLDQFGLFLAVYYGFAGMGISFYCGLLLRSNADGGPGYWGQNNIPVTGTSPATDTPWGDTPYGGNPYYYNLNYNGYGQAIASLYVVMIQNNWSTAADGPVQVTNENHRWFFVAFTVMVAFVMINVLVGAIIDALNGVREEMLREKQGEHDPLEVVCQQRIDATITPSGGYYGDLWELGDVELYGEVRYDAELCDVFNPDADEAVSNTSAALEAEKAKLQAELDSL